MEHNTKIEWTHIPGYKGETWNPIVAYDADGRRGWHCEKISDGCAHCYSETRNKAGRCNMGTKLPFTGASRGKVRIELHEQTLMAPLRWRQPRGIFVCSMTDLYGSWVTNEMLDKIKAVEALCPQHVFIELTKRPERMAEYLNTAGREVHIGHAGFDSIGLWKGSTKGWSPQIMSGRMIPRLPLPNIMLGTSVENQQAANERIPHLLRCPAAVRFLSCEPLLGAVDLREYIGYNPMYENAQQGSGRVQCGASWIVGDHDRRNDLEGCGDAGQSLEQSCGFAEGQTTKSRTRSGSISTSSANDSREADVLYGSPACVDALQRANTRWNADQSHQRAKEGQQADKLGTGDSIGQHSARGQNIEGGTSGESVGSEESRFHSHGCADRGHTSVVRNERRYSSETGKTVQCSAPDNFADSSGRPSSEAGGACGRLHGESSERRGQALISWTICGGESGPKARPCDIAWIRSIVAQCKAAGTPCFVKQLGARPVDGSCGCDEPPGTKYPEEAWLRLKERKGGDWSEWPADLKVRDFPKLGA